MRSCIGRKWQAMTQKPDPALEERERLEQFLKWRQAVTRRRKARHTLFFVVGALLGVAAVVLATPPGRILDISTRLASRQVPGPAQNIAAFGSGSASAVAPRSSDVGGSASLQPPRSVAAAEAVAIDPAERVVVQSRRPSGSRPRTLRQTHRVEPALPPRPPSSQRPNPPENVAQASAHAPAASLPPTPYPVTNLGEAAGTPVSSTQSSELR